MATFLTTAGVSHELENIIKGAKTHIWLVSPYLQVSKTLFERLKAAINRGIKVTIIYGKNELKEEQYELLRMLNPIDLHFFVNLHAKCYFNEHSMIITSMNMYEYSERTNREMGILINRSTDKDIYNAAAKETLEIWDAADKVELSTLAKLKQPVSAKKATTFTANSVKGLCIRCEKNIPYSPDCPYCPSCYGIWAQYGNEDYLEAVCHQCGKEADTSMNRPLCYNCFSRQSYSYR
ncbi:phospholipase D family protein [Hymenobacter jeollabukensis]|uniref:Phospholipase D-like domain-containing protein n=1 Tax=Hymenobacter jeollabukensis TaxID=2025313 RepID=A0A5R8WM50_9BACT|nr:phospholipase D family protein [Hymenobacter jeollabukensis]TLM90038.1 hypothetical protein FDY95_18635 [Hymenobacter jeollabukensis]